MLLEGRAVVLYLFALGLLLSPLTALIIGALPRRVAKRLTIGSLWFLVPASLGSCFWWTALGEAGFLSNAQGVATLFFLLLVSVGVGYGAASLRHALLDVWARSRRPPQMALLEEKPWRWFGDDDLG